MFLFKDRYRYFVLLLSLLCLASISSNMSTFNFAIVCMEPEEGNSTNNSTTTKAPNAHHYSTNEQSMLMWSVGVGSMVGTFPFSYGYSKWGARWVFAIAGILSAISTALSPLAASLGLWTFIFIRFVQGISYSADFASIGLLCTRWSSLKQLAFYISVLTCYSPLSTSITYLASGYICSSSLGWPFIYYFHSIAGLFLFTLWILFFKDHPAQSRHVTEKEKALIERDKSEEELAKHVKVPYWEICKNPIVLMIWYNAFIEIGSGVFLMAYTPLYLRNVHKYSVEMTGILSSITTTIVIPIRMSFGLVSDRISFWSERTKMNIFNTASLLGPAICYVVIGFASNEDHFLVVSSIILIYLCYSTSGGGFYKCASYTCRQYSHFVIATMQFIKCICLFAAPLIYALCVKDQSRQDQWAIIFFSMAVALVLGAVLFLWLSNDKPLPFTMDSLTKKANKVRPEIDSVSLKLGENMKL